MLISDLKSVEIEINGSCNRACSYCPNSISSRKNVGEMDLRRFDLIIKQLQDGNFKGVLSFHFYNEPLLHPLFFEFVTKVKERLSDSILKIYSNGTLLTIELFREAVKRGVDHFIITKHRSEREGYLFDKTYLKLTDQELKLVTFVNESKILKSNRGGILGDEFTEPLLLKMPCFIPGNMIVITCEGNLIPCFEDYFETQFMGNVFEISLDEILSSEKFLNFVLSLRKGRRDLFNICKNCNRYEVMVN